MTCCKVTSTITTIKIDNLLFGESIDPLTKVYHSQSKVFNLFMATIWPFSIHLQR